MHLVRVLHFSQKVVGVTLIEQCLLTLPGGGGGGGKCTALPVFFHHPETLQAFTLKLSDFEDTSLRHILQIISVRYSLSCYHGIKITQGSSQNLAPKRSEKSVICKAIGLKFYMEGNFGRLTSKSNTTLQFDVSMTS